MCTVSWTRTGKGARVFFNRDEQRSRAEARPPRRHVHPETGVRFIAPVDPDSGGTWVFANEHGLAAGLLNNYNRAFEPPRTPVSRGKLMWTLAGTPSPADLGRRLERELAEKEFAPCFVFAVAADAGPALWEWDGETLRSPPLPALPFHTTSSLRPAETAAYRRERFLEAVRDPARPRAEELEAFHRRHDPARPAASVRMARADARTHSTTRIDLTSRRAVMSYRPARGPESRVEISRGEL